MGGVQRVWLDGTGAGQGVWLGWRLGRRAVSVPALSPILTPHSLQAVRKPLAVGGGSEAASCTRVWPSLPPPLLHALGAREMRRAAGEASRPQQVKGIHQMFTGVYMPCVDAYVIHSTHTWADTREHPLYVCSYTLSSNIHLHTPRCRMQQGAPLLPAVPTHRW